MTSTQELEAKAALINFLRASRLLNSRSIITTELVIDKQSVRADVVVSDLKDLHCIEIKTERDTLARLDKQVHTYARHADFVTVASATKHVSAVMSRVPSFVGILEISPVFGPGTIRMVREPQISPLLDVDCMLSLLPVNELCRRLDLQGRQRRSDALAQAILLPSSRKKAAVLSFLRDRYRQTSRALLRATRKRQVKAADLHLLRRWKQGASSSSELQNPHDASPVYRCIDHDVFQFVGGSFGPVPEEVRVLLGN